MEQATGNSAGATDSSAGTSSAGNTMVQWNKRLAPFKKSDARKATFQVLNTLIPFVGMWYLMLRSLEVSYWLTLLLAIPTAGLSIRLFIFQHDCGHGSFYSSQRWNNFLGSLLGVITFTPYHYWRRTHAVHHATAGNLDRRELGDVDTLTVNEYLARGFWQRLRYRLYRSPFVLFVLGPAHIFVVKHRFPWDAPMSWKKEWMSVWGCNLVYAGAMVLSYFTIGIDALLMVQLPITLIAGSIGVWLFYVQHQFEDTYWENQPHWDFAAAGLEGSSFYDLPAWLHWFTGNIGYHHLHHLSSRIPNYRLRDCVEHFPELQGNRISLRQSLGCIHLRLWDEESRRLVGFRHLRHLREAPVPAAPATPATN